jgi:hypothetical protein
LNNDSFALATRDQQLGSRPTAAPQTSLQADQKLAEIDSAIAESNANLAQAAADMEATNK